MILTRSDLPFVKWSLLCLLAAATADSIAVLYGENMLDRKVQALHAARQRLDQVRRLPDTAKTHSQETEKYLHEYEMLLKRGVVSNGQPENETRFRLLSFMENVRERHPLPYFSYALLSQRTGTAFPSSAEFDLYGNGMNMHFTLLHEEQLFAFLDTLRNEAHDLFTLERCSMERGDDGLRAECTGNWVTLIKRTGK